MELRALVNAITIPKDTSKEEIAELLYSLPPQLRHEYFAWHLRSDMIDHNISFANLIDQTADLHEKASKSFNGVDESEWCKIEIALPKNFVGTNSTLRGRIDPEVLFTSFCDIPVEMALQRIKNKIMELIIRCKFNQETEGVENGKS